MIWLEDINHMIFISSPRISSLTELMEMNVFLSDIPLYDVTRELVLLNQQRIAEIDVAYVFFYTNVGHISSLVYVIFILSRKKYISTLHSGRVDLHALLFNFCKVLLKGYE